ncbi:MAG: hypothetical protein ACKVP7_10435 [Hyphomicrobiaceae bacterium]
MTIAAPLGIDGNVAGAQRHGAGQPDQRLGQRGQRRMRRTGDEISIVVRCSIDQPGDQEPRLGKIGQCHLSDANAGQQRWIGHNRELGWF